MNPFKKLELAMLQAFAEMLDLAVPSESSSKLENDKTKKLIESKLAKGLTVTKTVNGFTPFMLYIAYHILDQRFDEAFQKIDEIRSQATVVLGPKVTRQLNTLDVAVISKNVLAIERLLGTKVFDENHHHALELAAVNNLSAAIRLFSNQGYNLFAHRKPLHTTILMIACSLSSVDVVREIFLTNPSEQELNISESFTDLTAADFALNSCNEKIISLFLPTKRFQQALLIQAYQKENSAKVIAVLNATYTTANLLLLHSQNKCDSLLVGLYRLPSTNKEFTKQIITAFENYLSRQPAYEKINTLLLTYANMFHIDTEAANKYWQQLSEILETLPRDKVLKEFIIPSFMNCDNHAVLPQVRNVVEKITEFNLIEQLYFAKPEGMTEADAIFIINCLKDNTSIVQCDITWLKALSQPLKNMIELICKRNIAITQAQTHLVKDAIFNSSVVELNGLINAYQEDATIDAKTRMRLEPHIKTARVYSLMELAAATFYTTPRFPNGCDKTPLMAEPCTEMLNNMSLLPKNFRQTPNPK